MKAMADNSVDAIVTDPPYELGFMGKSWDASGIAFNIEVWQEALRVIKPGGHLIAFSGSRTYHRMAVAIEDAGFQIRDQIMWVYGSGFPKSHNISKGIDKRGGKGAMLAKEIGEALCKARESRGISKSKADKMFCDSTTNWTWFEGRPAGQRPPTPETFARIVSQWTELAPLAELVAEAEREVVGKGSSTLINSTGTYAVTNGEAGEEWKPKDYNITAPATPAAQQWDGWGTALKPAHEPMVLARKPLEGTVANNVLTYGTGGLNIDGTRVGSDEMIKTTSNGVKISENRSMSGANFEREVIGTITGRFPANFIHDGSDEVVGLFPQGGASGKASGPTMTGASISNSRGKFNGVEDSPFYNDSGSAARFFYCAKASKKDRNEGLDGFEEKRTGAMIGNLVDGQRIGGDGSPISTPVRANHHPTVKPTTLMQYLVRLVTPPNGIVLDPFMGSGSTGKACAYEGFDFIGIDQSAEYVEIARARIFFAIATNDEKLDL
jgi:DNA modification methylase